MTTMVMEPLLATNCGRLWAAVVVIDEENEVCGDNGWDGGTAGGTEKRQIELWCT